MVVAALLATLAIANSIAAPNVDSLPTPDHKGPESARLHVAAPGNHSGEFL